MAPLPLQIFSNLGETHWTLLVNEVNRHVPEVRVITRRACSAKGAYVVSFFGTMGERILKESVLFYVRVCILR